MTTLESVFWTAAGLVVYTYFVYPCLLAQLARWRPRPVQPRNRPPRSVSIVLAVFNEEARIVQRLEELTRLLALSGVKGEILVVSDGCTDATPELARDYVGATVRVIELPERLGKSLALTAGWAAARNEILVFADARQSWEPDALEFLLQNFADPTIGAVTGDLIVNSKPGVMTGVGFYWRFEKWLRRQESRVWAMVGATGAISAVRRDLFRPIPPGTLLDDVYWPLCVVMQGHRVIHDERAHAHDCLPEKAQDEFRRKVRTQAGNFQLLTRLPGALLPWSNPVWLQFLSHKLLRLAVPWALLVLLVSSALLPGALYQTLLGIQIVCYMLGLVGLVCTPRLGGRLFAAAASFLVLNAASFTAFWVWIFGQAGHSWTKVVYHLTPDEALRHVPPRRAESMHVDSVS